MTWIRSEPLVLRPFYALADLEDALDNAKISVRAGDEPTSDTALLIEQPEHEEIVIEIFPNIDTAILKGTLAKDLAKFSWVIVIRDPMKMKKSLFKTWDASLGIPEAIQIREKDLPGYVRDRDFEISISLCLAESIKPKLGWPSNTGNWVCEKVFQFKRPFLQSSFDIRPLTEDILHANNLPTHSLVHVDILGSVSEKIEDGDCFAFVYVAEKILDAMKANRGSGGLLSIMEYEIICGILHTIGTAAEFDELEQIMEGSPLDRIVKQLDLKKENQLETVSKILKDPMKIRASVADSLKISNALEKL